LVVGEFTLEDVAFCAVNGGFGREANMVFGRRRAGVVSPKSRHSTAIIGDATLARSSVRRCHLRRDALI
jgi:hypothetical protein